MEFNLRHIYDSLFGKAFKASAMSSLLWINGLVSLPCIVLATFSEDLLTKLFLFAFPLILIVYFIFKFNYFAKTNPTYLQSENYQIEKQKWDIVGEKGGPISFHPVDVTPDEGGHQLPSGHDSEVTGED